MKKFCSKPVIFGFTVKNSTFETSSLNIFLCLQFLIVPGKISFSCFAGLSIDR